MRLCLLTLALTLLVANRRPAQEVRVPAFDHGKVKASYVVSLPDAPDSGRAWPLILDFHGAIAPSRKGANLTRDRLWAEFARKAECIVVGLNCRTRGWNRVKGEKDDVAYALHVLAEVRKSHAVDAKRIYLAGFSSGSDFLCAADLQHRGPFAGSLVVCPGPPNVVGLRDGSLLEKKDHPFYFVTGEEDYIRKAGPWQAFLAVHRGGGRALFREVPAVAHAFPPVSVYVRLFRDLERFASIRTGTPECLAWAREALGLGDDLQAAILVAGGDATEKQPLLETIEKRGRAALREAASIDAAVEPGRAYEAWWKLRTNYFACPPLADRAEREMAALEKKVGRRELYRVRRAWFRKRKLITDIQQKRGTTRARSGLWTFDHYLTYPELTAHVKDLAARHPEKVRLISLGKSIEKRELWLLEITDPSSGPPGSKPAVYVQGCLHGNEVSSMMNVLYFAYKLAENPEGRRGIGRILASTTFYAAPAVNPDAAHHYLTEPHCHWRPRFNYRPHDRDGDGRVDEDPYADLDGDGEIGFMYRPDPEGAYVVEGGRVVRRREGSPRYTLVGREGIDNDGDGKIAEDRPGGVDLNRNFPVGFRPGKAWEGSRGAGPASEPETEAIIGFVSEHPNVQMFVDYHNAASCLFYWLGPEPDPKDLALYQAMAGRAAKTLGYAPRPLRHGGAGLSIAWAHGRRGIASFIVELEATLGPEEKYFKERWKGDVFIPPRPFNHPQLGEILIGNDFKKIPKRNLYPPDVLWQAERNFAWLEKEMQGLARLKLEDPIIQKTESGYRVSGTVINTGDRPTDLAAAHRAGTARPVRVAAEGADISGPTDLGDLEAGGRRAFKVSLGRPRDDVTLVIHHPRAGSVRFPITRPRSKTRTIRREYAIEAGYATPDRARLANNAFFRHGRSDEERGPAFKVTNPENRLNIAVLLAEWKDRRHTLSRSDFETMFFSTRAYCDRSPTGQPVYGSVRDFYDEMSYGRMTTTGKVFDWVELPGKYEDYRQASFGSPIVQKKLTEAVLARYGRDALDGFNGLVFIWAGNNVTRVSALWPMRLKLEDRPGVAAFKMAEHHLGEAVPIGVACHEMGHTFGVDDKYGLGATKSPLGPWCLMGKGTHGGPPSGRHRPFHLCAWCKMVIGWIHPAVVDPSEPQKLALRPILHGPGECYRILLEPDGSEYLLLENRRREGFLTDLPSPGLAILRVGPNDAPAYPQTRVQLLPAHGLRPLRRGVIARPEAVAWPQTGRDELVVGRVRLHDIRLVDDVVYLEVGPVKPDAGATAKRRSD